MPPQQRTAIDKRRTSFKFRRMRILLEYAQRVEIASDYKQRDLQRLEQEVVWSIAAVCKRLLLVDDCMVISSARSHRTAAAVFSSIS